MKMVYVVILRDGEALAVFSTGAAAEVFARRLTEATGDSLITISGVVVHDDGEVPFLTALGAEPDYEN